MIVKTYYDTGRLDVFDTATMTDGSVVPGNLMSNWSVKLRGLHEEQTLWATMSWYQATGNDAAAGPDGAPIARLREGWSFVLADLDDVPHLERVEIDGRTAIMRQGSYLMDCMALDSAEDRAFTVNPKTVATHDYYAASGNGGERPTPSEFERIGCDEESYATISLAKRLNRKEENGDEDLESLC